MTNYRRLISYIYAYEGEVKGKNIGFAKLESRNGQCKLSVNVKKVYVGSSDLGVYLLAPGKEIFLGSIFIRSGGGEFRAVVNVENAADSGCGMDQCYGLTIHEQGDAWRAYTTIWEDAVAHAAEVELADVTSSRVGNAEAQIHRKVEELNQELRAGETDGDSLENSLEDGLESGPENSLAKGPENSPEKGPEDSPENSPEDGPVLSSSQAGIREIRGARRGNRNIHGAQYTQTADAGAELQNGPQPGTEAAGQALTQECTEQSPEGDPASAWETETVAPPEGSPEPEAVSKAEELSAPEAVSEAEELSAPEAVSEAEELSAPETVPETEQTTPFSGKEGTELPSDGMDMMTEPYIRPVNNEWYESGYSEGLYQEPYRETGQSPQGLKNAGSPMQNGSFRSGYDNRQHLSWDKASPASIRRQLYSDNRSGMGMPLCRRPVPGPMPGTMPEAVPGSASVPVPETMPGAASGPMSGTAPGTVPEAASGPMPGTAFGPVPETMPEAMPGTAPETMPGAASGPMPGTAPETTPETSSDTVPDTTVPLRPDDRADPRTASRGGMMARPGMPRRQAPMGGRYPNAAMSPVRQEKVKNRQIQPPVWQPDTRRTQPIPESGGETLQEPEEKEPVVDEGEEPLILGDPQELERLEQEEQQNHLPQQLWDGFRKRYPKVQAFDSVSGCEILTIKPQDIGLLPRENWNYGNNSFLLHGYYNYRYLILARIGDDSKGRARYILGVPGNYYSNEKYMASMFGFPHFVLAKKQPSQDGRFGYWYADIRLENQD